MAVLQFNGMLAVSLSVGGGSVSSSLPATVWSAEESGTQLLDLVDHFGGTGGQVKPGPAGRFKFDVTYPDGSELALVWLDFGVGGRWPFRALESYGPPGAAGPGNTLTIGDVTKGPAAATVTGSSPNQVLNLVLPPGDPGARGPAGPSGGPVPATVGTDGDMVVKDGTGVKWATPDDVTAALVVPGTATGGALDGRYGRKAAVDVREFGALCDGVADDAAAVQAAINSVTVAGVTDPMDAPITVPTRSGRVVKLPAGDVKVSNLVLTDFVILEGAGIGATRLIVTGGITYATVFNTAMYTVVGAGMRDLRVKGATGTETLLAPGLVTDETQNRTEHTLTECSFRDVIFEDGAVGVDLRGWNNLFERVWFRNLDVGLNADTTAKRADPNTLVANPGDNLFSRCTFHDCDVSVKMRHGKGNVFHDCAAYRADVIHYWLGEGCNGNAIVGGRAEDAPQSLVRLDGADLVNVSGTVYQAIANHTADATNQPGTGASWAANWKVTTDWDTERTWVSGKSYFVTSAIANRLVGLDLYPGPASRTGRDGATIAKSASYAAVLLDGDQHTHIRDCWSGAMTDEQVKITDHSTSAVLLDNTEVRAAFAGTGTPSHSEEYQDYGTAVRTLDYSLLVKKLRKLSMQGETADFYWQYATTTPRAYSFRSDANVAMSVREASGVVHLPKQTWVKDLANATSTVISVTNVSTTDVVVITPRNATAATFLAANLGSIYAATEANDKVRITHPAGAPAGCTFNVVLL